MGTKEIRLCLNAIQYINDSLLENGKTMIIVYLVLAIILPSNCLEDGEVTDLLPRPVIGVYFDGGNASMRESFGLAIKTINHCMLDDKICEMMHRTEVDFKRRLFHQVEFTAITWTIYDDDVQSIQENFGKLAGMITGDVVDGYLPDEPWKFQYDRGLSLVVGPNQHVSSLYIQGLCELHDIPHFVIRRETDFEHSTYQTINFYPDIETLSNVYMDMIKVLNWTTFSVLYESTDRFVALNNILTMYPAYTHSVYGIKLGTGTNFTEPLLKAKKLDHKSFLIDCSFDILNDVLTGIQEVGMMTDNYKYVITTLDLHAIDWKQYQYSGVNIKGLQLVDFYNPDVRQFISDHLDDLRIDKVEKIRLEDALMFDAMMTYARAYKDLNYQNQMYKGATFIRDYDYLPHPWRQGLSLRNYMLATEIHGLTGSVAIDGDGSRRRFNLDVVNLHQTGLKKIAEWNHLNGFLDFKPEETAKLPHYKILLKELEPYAMKVKHSRSMDGNARFEGLSVDIIKDLAQEMKFTYTFYMYDNITNGNCEKKVFGNITVCDRCDGIMEKVMIREVDMAIGDLTVTENRARCIQFSTAFMNLGISILAKKPQKIITWYSFLKPFKFKVWLWSAFSIVVVSILFVVCGRLCPNEWNCPCPCIEEPEELENQFTFNNAVWFVIGAFLQQGSEIAPIGASTRILASVWYFFCLIIVNTYMANLAASLVIETPEKLMDNIKDLYDQTAIKFGAQINGSTVKYFQSSSDPNYQKLYERMIDPDWSEKYMVKSNEEGKKLVLSNDTNYVFFMESSAIDFIIKRECNLEKIGDLIDHKSYAIAFAKGFEAQDEVDRTISLLEEKSVLNKRRKEWMETKGAKCGETDSKTTESLTLEQLIGAFMSLIVGLAIAFFVTVYSFCRNVRAITKEKQLPHLKTAMLELKNSIKSKPIKPVLVNQISTDSTSGDLTMTTQA